jgi:uncharacterized membrane-anchored protein YhcB (DUF1043 family)
MRIVIEAANSLLEWFMKKILIVVLAVVIGCAIAGVHARRQAKIEQQAKLQTQRMKSERAAELNRHRQQLAPALAAASQPLTALAEPNLTVVQDIPQAARQTTLKPGTTKPLSSDAATPSLKSTEPIIPEPMARMALSFVGADPEAEAVWMTAINDPNLSPDTRQNLIEDLNEDGFSDPEHPTAADLPLIVRRMRLLEHLDAMDQVNNDAIAEAYKDLVNMFGQVTQN